MRNETTYSTQHPAPSIQDPKQLARVDREYAESWQDRKHKTFAGNEKFSLGPTNSETWVAK